MAVLAVPTKDEIKTLVASVSQKIDAVQKLANDIRVLKTIGPPDIRELTDKNEKDAAKLLEFNQLAAREKDARRRALDAVRNTLLLKEQELARLQDVQRRLQGNEKKNAKLREMAANVTSTLLELVAQIGDLIRRFSDMNTLVETRVVQPLAALTVQ